MGQRDVVLGERAELLHVGPALLALLRPILEIRLVPAQRDELVDEPWKRQLLRRRAQAGHDLAERRQRFLLAARDGRDELGLCERLPGADLVLARAPEESGARLVTQATRRRVEEPPHGEPA